MTSFEQVMDRIGRARALGWVFEDTYLTPGVPRMAAIPPGKTRDEAKMVWSLGWVGREEKADKELDEAGVPK